MRGVFLYRAAEAAVNFGKRQFDNGGAAVGAVVRVFGRE